MTKGGFCGFDVGPEIRFVSGPQKPIIAGKKPKNVSSDTFTNLKFNLKS